MKHKMTIWLNTIFLALITTVVYGQEKNITGTVSDHSGIPMPGVNVIVKGTQIGTSTDFDGYYNIHASPGDVIVFSYIGTTTIEKTVDQSNTYNVTLEPDQSELEEVVVIGYGTQRRSDVTGAIGSISSRNIEDAPPVAPEQILQGKIAGVNIVQNSGQPGAASTVRIRGASSISAGNDPLYVVDGVPLQFGSKRDVVSAGFDGGTTPLSTEVSNPMNIINPADIESINVLKDASATAIYGSRGANGVIVITTKTKSGGEGLSYDTSSGFSHVPKSRYLQVLSADQYRAYAQQRGMEFPDQGANTNWQDQIFRAAYTQNHNLAFSGGSNNTRLRASFGYNTQEGIIISNKMDKYTGRINATHTAMDGKLTIGVNMTYAYIDDDKVAISSSVANEGGNILKDGIRWAPTLPVYNQDGSYYQLGELRVNPVSWKDVTDESFTNMFLGNADISYTIIDGLKASAMLGYSNQGLDRFTHIPDTHPVGASEGGRASINKNKNTSELIELTLNYDKQLNDKHYINVLAGYSFQRFEYQNTYTLANQFVSSATAWNLMQSGNILSNTSFKDANRLVSYYGRINYRFMDKYMLTFTLRRDGSSRFGQNNRWGTFPSAALAWNIANESFMEGSAISRLKIRSGFGVTGNQEIPNNLYREQLSIRGSSIYVFGSKPIPSVLPINYANPDLKWEETTQWNFGLDFGFIDNRFTGSVDYYIKNTNDLLLSFNTASPSVVDNQWANVGEVKNVGIEVNLDYNAINSDSFTWDTNLNFSSNKNEVVTLSNENFSRDEMLTAEGSGVISNDTYTQIIRPGLPMGSFYGRVFQGFDENGMELYKDEDGEDGADLEVIGNPFPDFIFGFNNSFTYKNLDASINFRGVIGNDIYNNTRAEFSYPIAFPGINVLESTRDSQVSDQQSAQFSSRWIEDGSYLRLDNASLGYTFNSDNFKFLSRLRLYISGKNLFVITGYSGYDPEMQTRANGIDYLAYPRPRTYLIGLNASF